MFYDTETYPEWRTAPTHRNQPPSANRWDLHHIDRKDVGLASLMRLDDEVMKRDGATLVTYQEMQACLVAHESQLGSECQLFTAAAAACGGVVVKI